MLHVSRLVGPLFWSTGCISELHSHPHIAALTVSNVLKERTFPRIILLLKCMCSTCYFRFIGVYLLPNNEPEGNGNLNRLKNWSRCHQKLPVLYWCSVATLFAYSAGQMCLLQHFGWNPDSHLQKGWDFILWTVCLWENVREVAVTALQHDKAVHMHHHEALRMD